MSLRLLVVDDEPDVMKVVKSILESFGYEVLGLTDSRQAVERVERQKFDGIFVDARMPGVDGIELVRRIRNSASNISVPIVMLTGYDDVDTMRAAFRAGITFFMPKPPDMQKLANLLRPMQAAMLREKRSYARLPLRTIVNCRLGKHEFKSLSANLSEGGMLLEGSGGLEPGQEVELRFTLPNNPSILNPRAVVARKEVGDRFAVKFTHLEAEERHNIQEFIAGAVKG